MIEIHLPVENVGACLLLDELISECEARIESRTTNDLVVSTTIRCPSSKEEGFLRFRLEAQADNQAHLERCINLPAFKKVFWGR